MDPPVLVTSLVYALVFRKTSKIVYVGSTVRGGTRWKEHIDLVSGCRRVAIALSRARFQPVLDHFELRELWMGECTGRQAKAIEQHFMNKHRTRVTPRPTNGITKDVDLYAHNVDPEQLNIVRACSDDPSLDWARLRVQHDSAIVSVRTSSEEHRVKSQLVELLLESQEAATNVVSVRIAHWRAVFAAMRPNELVSIKEIDTAMKDINSAWTEEDGKHLRDVLRCRLLWYNDDKRANNDGYQVSLVSQELNCVAVAAGMTIENSPDVRLPRIVEHVTFNLFDFNTRSDVLSHLTEQVVGMMQAEVGHNEPLGVRIHASIEHHSTPSKRTRARMY